MYKLKYQKVAPEKAGEKNELLYKLSFERLKNFASVSEKFKLKDTQVNLLNLSAENTEQPSPIRNFSLENQPTTEDHRFAKKKKVTIYLRTKSNETNGDSLADIRM